MTAILQQAIIDYAVGPPNTITTWDQFLDKPSPGTLEHDLCSQQITRNPEYASFSVLGLVITFLIGGLIIILDFLTPVIHRIRMHRRRKRDANAPDWWDLNDFLRLQERLLEKSRKQECRCRNVSATSSNRRMNLI